MRRGRAGRVGDHPEVRGQQGRHPVPGSLGCAKAVEQHGRGAVAAATGVTYGKRHPTAQDRLLVPSHASEPHAAPYLQGSHH